MKFVSGGPDGLRQPLRRFDMQESSEHPVEEIKRLQRCISDLVSLLALRAAWRDSKPAEIGHSLLDTLLGLLHLDLVYVRLKDAPGDEPLEMVQVAPSQTLMPAPQEICAMLNQSFGADPANWPPLVRLPIGDGAHFGRAHPAGPEGGNRHRRGRVPPTRLSWADGETAPASSIESGVDAAAGGTTPERGETGLEGTRSSGRATDPGTRSR